MGQSFAFVLVPPLARDLGLSESELKYEKFVPNIKINDKKKFIVAINSVTIEADSLLIIANVRKENETESGFSNFSDVEFRFYPKI